MANLILRRRLIQQPQNGIIVNPDLPIAGIDVPTMLGNNSVIPPIGIGPQGRFYSTSAAASRYSAKSINRITLNGGATHLIVFRAKASETSFERLSTLSDSVPLHFRSFVQVYSNGTAVQVGACLNSENNLNYADFTVPNLIDGEIHTLLAGWEAANGSCYVYLDGKLIGNSTVGNSGTAYGSANRIASGALDYAGATYIGSYDIYLNCIFNEKLKIPALISALNSNPWQTFAPQKQVIYFNVGVSSGSTTLAINNTLESLTNNLSFGVSPVLSIAQDLSSVTNSLEFSVSPALSFSSTLEDTLNNLNFSMYSGVALSNTLDSCANVLSFSVPVALTLSNALEVTSSSLDFSVLGYTGLEIVSALEGTTNAISFSVSPVLTVATTLTDVLNALDFTVSGANNIALNTTLESILVDLSFEVSPRLLIGQSLESLSNLLTFSVSPKFSLATTLDGTSSTLSFANELTLSLTNILEDSANSINFTVSSRLALSGTFADVQNVLAFTGYVNPDVYFETIRLGLKVNTSPRVPLKINLVSNIPLEL